MPSVFDTTLLLAISRQPPKVQQVAAILEGCATWEVRFIPKALYNRSTIEKVQRITGMRLQKVTEYSAQIVVIRVPGSAKFRYSKTRKKDATDRTVPCACDDNRGGAR